MIHGFVDMEADPSSQSGTDLVTPVLRITKT